MIKLMDLVKEAFFIGEDEPEIKKEAKKTKKPCWKGYEQIGMKTKNGRQVPNCVPVKSKSK